MNRRGTEKEKTKETRQLQWGDQLERNLQDIKTKVTTQGDVEATSQKFKECIALKMRELSGETFNKLMSDVLKSL